MNVDAKLKLVTKWTSTDASVHDSEAFESVLRTPGEGGADVSADVFADSAYRSEKAEAMRPKINATTIKIGR